ncbi:hypothetical protein [Meiothermus ruber]|jgi:hypothetical protein|uniref:Uncharacterized protein n=1 Tax=Meiothermus ruber (strain ATCC 35948 / DSM 1279 / VKM B-1258 / 21) TaxID=504728 RepID=D3PP86_MEIRD|nr:hypothetical protein [Meiothermus ruber]ADD27495.1 hypothetical protein Mrub_0729 [Meiothermus ruber DSM 1279]AGK03959.1 hypothetical protein K649_03285 [Meiothermus ruber DSM 1279]MCL6530649.1 hypothetical protein [Meiothermus ruber]GAO74422.1 putative uncharacterized protein [Meiothermus ruber H328]
MKTLLLGLLLLLGAPALAQTLVEVTAVAAITSSLDASVRFPSGSFKAGRGSEAIVARIPDASRFNLEVYAARGVAARLQPGFVQQILTGFAAAGYFVENQQETQVAGEVRTRYNLRDETGRAALLFVVRKGDELVFAFGVAR